MYTLLTSICIIYNAGGQAATVGMLPPSDSEDYTDSDDEEAPVGQNPRMGELPPSSSEEEDSSDDEDKEEKKSRRPAKPGKPAVPDEPRRKKDEVDPEQMRVDMEKLELVKKRREEQRLKRIAEEGWDRFAPISETNKPPGSVLPPDHPSLKE